jgi:hypothetical protein
VIPDEAVQKGSFLLDAVEIQASRSAITSEILVACCHTDTTNQSNSSLCTIHRTIIAKGSHADEPFQSSLNQTEITMPRTTQRCIQFVRPIAALAFARHEGDSSDTSLPQTMVLFVVTRDGRLWWFRSNDLWSEAHGNACPDPRSPWKASDLAAGSHFSRTYLGVSLLSSVVFLKTVATTNNDHQPNTTHGSSAPSERYSMLLAAGSSQLGPPQVITFRHTAQVPTVDSEHTHTEDIGLCSALNITDVDECAAAITAVLCLSVHCLSEIFRRNLCHRYGNGQFSSTSLDTRSCSSIILLGLTDGSVRIAFVSATGPHYSQSLVTPVRLLGWTRKSASSPSLEVHSILPLTSNVANGSAISGIQYCAGGGDAVRINDNLTACVIEYGTTYVSAVVLRPPIATAVTNESNAACLFDQPYVLVVKDDGTTQLHSHIHGHDASIKPITRTARFTTVQTWGALMPIREDIATTVAVSRSILSPTNYLIALTATGSMTYFQLDEESCQDILCQRLLRIAGPATGPLSRLDETTSQSKNARLRKRIANLECIERGSVDFGEDKLSDARSVTKTVEDIQTQLLPGNGGKKLRTSLQMTPCGSDGVRIHVTIDEKSSSSPTPAQSVMQIDSALHATVLPCRSVASSHRTLSSDKNCRVTYTGTAVSTYPAGPVLLEACAGAETVSSFFTLCTTAPVVRSARGFTLSKASDEGLMFVCSTATQALCKKERPVNL